MSTISCSPKLSNVSLEELTIDQIHQDLKAKKYTARQLVQSYLTRIEAIDKNGPKINSVIEINPDALTIADQVDKEIAANGFRSKMHGIPVLLKDNIDTGDKMMTTAGSRALIESYASKDSHVAKKLRESGAIIIGKTNLSEWANFRGEGSTSGWSGRGGQTKNPYILDRNPCGSSAGSGVSVSANLTMVAIGTETNGSIVCPSNANGIVGIKPTVGLISRAGIIPISYTQDTPGPMTRTLRDAVYCLDAMIGIDVDDVKTLESKGKTQISYADYLKGGSLIGKKIGLYKSPMGRDKKVDSLMYRAIDELKKLGAEIIDIEEIAVNGVGAKSFEIMLYEYKDGLNAYFKSLGPDAKIKSIEDLIAFNLKDSIELKYFNQRYLEMALEKDPVTSEKYKLVLDSMLVAARENGIDRIMDKYKVRLDAIIAPTGSPAWPITLGTGDVVRVSSSSPAARAGYPNITVPMGFIGELPVGISFFGRAWSEGILIEIAYAYEQASMRRQSPKFLEK
jgi:amidase